MSRIPRSATLLAASVLELGAVVLSYSCSHLVKESWTTTPRGLEYTPVTMFSAGLFFGSLLIATVLIWGVTLAVIRRRE